MGGCPLQRDNRGDRYSRETALQYVSVFQKCFRLKSGFDFMGLDQTHIQLVILVCASTVDAGEDFIDDLMVSLKSCRPTDSDWVIRAERIAMVSRKVSSHVHDSPPPSLFTGGLTCSGGRCGGKGATNLEVYRTSEFCVSGE